MIFPTHSSIIFTFHFAVAPALLPLPRRARPTSLVLSPHPQTRLPLDICLCPQSHCLFRGQHRMPANTFHLENSLNNKSWQYNIDMMYQEMYRYEMFNLITLIYYLNMKKISYALSPRCISNNPSHPVPHRWCGCSVLPRSPRSTLPLSLRTPPWSPTSGLFPNRGRMGDKQVRP